MAEAIKIIITDDKQRYREIVRDILAPFPVNIIGEAENGEQCLQLLAEGFTPDLILLDLEMPVLDGNKTFDLLSKNYPSIKVIILSFHYDHLLIENYLDRGARGYLVKDGIADTNVLLINAIQKVHAGGTFVYEKQGEKHPYSLRQKQIMPLIFEGKTNEEIGREIGITTRSVEKQRSKIYEITGVGKAIDFYRYAFSRGLQYLGFRHKRS